MDKWTKDWIKTLSVKNKKEIFVVMNDTFTYPPTVMTGKEYNELLLESVALDNPTTDEDFMQVIPHAFPVEQELKSKFEGYGRDAEDVLELAKLIYKDLFGEEPTNEGLYIDYKNDILSINETRDGFSVLWYKDENKEQARYIDDGRELTDEEIEAQF